MASRAEVVAEMKLKTKMANNILKNLMEDNTLAYSSYYNEYILPALKSENHIGTKRREQEGRIEESRFSNYYILKEGSLGYSKQDLKERIMVANRIIEQSKEGGMISRPFIENNVDRLMNKFAFINKDTLLKVYEIYRSSNFSEYIKYEIDQTDYESVISRTGRLIEAGVTEQEIDDIWTKIENKNKNSFEGDTVSEFKMALTNKLIEKLSEDR